MIRYSYFFTLLTIFNLVLTSGRVTAQDPLQVSPEIYKLILDNDQVRVIEYQAKPGQIDKMHSFPQRLAYTLTPVKLRIMAPDGSISQIEATEGDTYWLGPVTHSLENIGTTEAKMLIIEIKDQPRRSTIPLKQTDPWGSPW
ncbi:MAG: hypothetical protein HY693_03535 [Deltaproteobacteria bacterium]|nr:hypothetical protein [Deltaproteobacteria bacterium]